MNRSARLRSLYFRLFQRRFVMRLLRRNHGFGTASADRGHQFVRIITFVGNDAVWSLVAQEFYGACNVVFFAWAETDVDRLSLDVYGDVQFGTEPAA
jgi:hypothetical protein